MTIDPDKDLKIAWRRADEAIQTGDDDALRRVLIDQPRLVRHGFINTILLGEAVGLGRTGTVAVLLDAGFPVDEPDDSGHTALIMAASCGHADVVRLLLQAGADPDWAGEDVGSGDLYDFGRCALFHALYKDHREVVDLLEPVTSQEMRTRAYEAVAERQAEEFEKALPYSDETIWLLGATRRGDLESLSNAIEAGGDVNVKLKPEESHGRLGCTPLSFAAGQGRMDLVEALLQAGADPGVKDHRDRSAADVAATNGHGDVAALLRSTLRPPETEGN